MDDPNPDIISVNRNPFELCRGCACSDILATRQAAMNEHDPQRFPFHKQDYGPVIVSRRLVLTTPRIYFSAPTPSEKLRDWKH